ncbi:RCC1 domain-containing protein [Psychrobacillus sp. FSL H8-0510]|uniref:RCC1 domain-containing protein n=1 Tax=Psychrobacillus sp. FSL H8-0510 TaxID=2921394 RepID=UPI0030F803F5
MKNDANKQYKARNVLSNSILKSTLAASLLLSGFAGALGATGSISNFSVMQIAEAASNQQLSNVIGGGMKHALAITSDGSVYAWGLNDKGQLGDGTTTSRTMPTKINGMSNAVAVEAGSNHSLAITSDGSVYAWGDNKYGQLGIGSTENKNTPSKVNGLSNVVKVVAGEQQSLAITSDGSVYAWGNNGNGQLGDGSRTNQSTPLRLSSLSNVATVEVGATFSFAITSDGSVYAWGYNYQGQLGDGTTTQKLTPTKINGLSDVVAVDGGYEHSLALTSDGSVYAWGNNIYGQIGDGTISAKKTPVKISGLSNVVSIEAGFYHSLAITSDGSLYAWGYNSYGQLGDGTTKDKTKPTKINSLSNVVEVEGGGLQSLAITSDGSIYSWGQNGNGQLGNGTTTQKNTPTLLVDIKAGIAGDPALEEQIATATASVAKAEGSKLQADVTTAKALVNALPDSTEKTNLTTRLDTVQKAIDDAIALVTQIATATTSVVKAEGSKLQADVTSALMLVNALPTGTEKTSLTNRLNIVQKAIDDAIALAEQIATTTTSVVKAEGSKLQVDVTAARTLVTALPNGTDKTNLTSRLDTVQTAINLATQIATATTSVVKAEGSGLQVDVDTSRLLVNNLPIGTEKTNLTNRLNVVQKAIDDAKALVTQIATATTSVVKAEGSKLQVDVTAARTLVTALPNGTDKTNLTSRLDTVQTAINLATQIATATTSVMKAEGSTLQADVIAARTLVNALPTGTEKTNLTSRLDTVQTAINLATQIATATTSVVKAEGSKLQVDVTAALTLVNALPTGTEKTSLTNRLNAVQKAIDDAKALATQIATATTAVVKAEGSKLQVDVTTARTHVNELPSGVDKTNLTNRLDMVQTAINLANQIATVTTFVVKAEESKLQEDVTSALTLVNALPTGTEKTSLTNRLNIAQKAIDDAIALVEQIATVTTAVVKAEGSKLQVDVTAARTLVTALPAGTEKTNLTNRLDLVQTAINLATQIAAATTSVMKAEGSKLQVDVTAALTLVNALPTGTEKTSLTNRLNIVQKAIDDAKELAEQIATATTAVVKAEGSKIQVDVTAARTLVTVLPAGTEKTNLTNRLDSVQTAINLATQIETATASVFKSEESKLQGDVTVARTLVEALPTGTEKTNLTNRLNIVQKAIDDAIALAEQIATTTTSVVKAEGSKLQADVTAARTLVNTLPTGTEKANLTNRLNVVQKAIDEAIALENQITTATTSVAKAEGSKLQADVTPAKALVNALPDSTEKTNLTTRLDAVQKAIDDAIALVTQIATATTSVVKAEGSKLQADVTSAKALVNALPNGTEKTNLENRLSILQDAIDASAVSYEEAMAELVDMKTYLLTGDGTREDVLAMKDALNVIHDDSASLLNEAHRTDVAHYVQDVLDIIGLLEIIWDKIASGELAGLDELVSQLPESELKDNTQQEVEDAKSPEIDNTLVEAVASVEKAEQSKLQVDVDASRSLVNHLPDSTDKTILLERLELVQTIIDEGQLLAEQIAQATLSVNKAETSKMQADIEAARSLVEALPSISEKNALKVRLDSIVVTPGASELVKEAQDAVDKLNDESTKEQIAIAKELVVKLPNSSTKTELNDRIISIELNQKAKNAVAQAEKMQTNYNITLAEKAINQLSDGPLKTELSERIQQLKLTLDAESKVKSAELTKREPYITEAMDSIAKLKDSPKKTELANRMKVIRDALAAEVEVALLEEAIAHVVLAEQHKRDPYLTSAKDLVSKLKEGTDKTALENRLKAIQDAAPVKPEAPVVDPALLKAAETQVSYAERYKRDPYLTRAQEAVDKLPNSEVKTALQERLDILSNGASEQIEAAKLKTATDSVDKAEIASDLFVIEDTRSLVNELIDGDSKQALVERLDAIEMTEAMRFAYDLKAEIDAITDVTIKQALQEAYTAVGVAKERQTSTYMTKASKSIEALSKYTATQSEVIEKLSTFFTDMQKELEMQKLIVAANNAVALAEKYKRAPYFAKAQVAIDVLSEGKAKADLQARHDAVMN